MQLETSRFIISIKPSSRLEELSEPRSTRKRKTSEEIEEIIRERYKIMENARQNLNALGLKEGQDYDLLVNLQIVNVSLTPEQADYLKKQSYVKVITKDFNLEKFE